MAFKQIIEKDGQNFRRELLVVKRSEGTDVNEAGFVSSSRSTAFFSAEGIETSQRASFCTGIPAKTKTFPALFKDRGGIVGDGNGMRIEPEQSAPLFLSGRRPRLNLDGRGREKTGAAGTVEIDDCIEMFPAQLPDEGQQAIPGWGSGETGITPAPVDPGNQLKQIFDMRRP